MVILCVMVNYVYNIFSECSKHCSLCYNETECYECTKGYFLSEIQECESKEILHSLFYLYNIQIT